MRATSLSLARATKAAFFLAAITGLAACGASGEAAQNSTTTSSTPTTTTIVDTTTSTATPTTPAIETDTHLLVVGDWGSGTLPQGAVAGAMAAEAERAPVAAILTTGDNFYSDDVDLIMTPYEWVEEAGIEWWVSWGNHDVEEDTRIAAVEEVFDSPPRWALHQWGALDVLILDSTDAANEDQLDFITDYMESTERPAIVVFHHPPYSCSKHGPTDRIVESWIPVFDEDVVLVLNGHEHNYQRFELDGTVYVVTGGGGRALYDLVECDPGQPSPTEAVVLHHFLSMSQTAGALEVTALDVNGEPIDSFDVKLD